MAAPFEPTSFDPTPYVHAPVITVATGATLALSLVDACPKTAPANVKKAAKHLKATAEKARADLAERNRVLGVFTDEDSRVLDNEADRAWGALRMRLQAMAMLSPERFPKTKRAAELDTVLFVDGLEFLKAEYKSQSTSMAVLLKRIDDDHLEADVNAIAGPDFLKAIRDVQPRYEAMVSERLRRDNATGQNLSATVRGLQAAIVNYASKMVGTIQRGSRCSPSSTTARRPAPAGSGPGRKRRLPRRKRRLPRPTPRSRKQSPPPRTQPVESGPSSRGDLREPV
jgi:hypothetical protein